jgi:hypothetical protein
MLICAGNGVPSSTLSTAFPPTGDRLPSTGSVVSCVPKNLKMTGHKKTRVGTESATKCTNIFETNAQSRVRRVV